MRPSTNPKHTGFQAKRRSVAEKKQKTNKQTNKRDTSAQQGMFRSKATSTGKKGHSNHSAGAGFRLSLQRRLSASVCVCVCVYIIRYTKPFTPCLCSTRELCKYKPDKSSWLPTLPGRTLRNPEKQRLFRDRRFLIFKIST